MRCAIAGASTGALPLLPCGEAGRGFGGEGRESSKAPRSLFERAGGDKPVPYGQKARIL